MVYNLGGGPSNVSRLGGVMSDNSSGHDLEREEFEKMIGKGLGRGLEAMTAEGSYVFRKVCHHTLHDLWEDILLYAP